MSRLTFILILVTLIHPGCAGPKVQFTAMRSFTGSATDRPAVVLREGQSPPTAAILVGDMKVSDSGLSINCSETDVLALIQRKAMEIGAQFVQLYDTNPPGILSSSCFRTGARFYVVETTPLSALIAESLSALSPSATHTSLAMAEEDDPTFPVAPAARVLVGIPDAQRPGDDGETVELHGVLVRATPSYVVVAVPPASGTLTVPRSSIRRFAKSGGVRFRIAREADNALGWALVGGILGAITTVGDEEGFQWERVGTWSAATVSIGLLFDIIWPDEEWRNMPYQPRDGVSNRER